MKQEALAEAVGVAGLSISHYENGRQAPRIEVLERIAAATGKPLAWFFQAEDAASAPAEPRAEPPAPQPDMQSLLAQLVAAQTQMLQAQARAEERADQRHNEMMQALTALAREQMQARAEAARTQRRLDQVEVDLRETDEGDDADCCEGQKDCSG